MKAASFSKLVITIIRLKYLSVQKRKSRKLFCLMLCIVPSLKFSFQTRGFRSLILNILSGERKEGEIIVLLFFTWLSQGLTLDMNLTLARSLHQVNR